MFRTDDLLPFGGFVFVNDIAGIIGDFEDGNGRHAFAAVGKNGIRGGHIDQADITATERKGEAIVIARERSKAKPFRHGDHPVFFRCVGIVVNSNILQCFDSGDIERI